MPLVPTRPQSETFQDQTAREIESLEKWISKTQKRILGDMDDDTFKMLTDELKVRKNRLAELKQPKRMDADSDAAQLAAFAEWWDSAKQTMISLEVPTDGQLHTSIAPDTVPMVYDFAADKLSKRSMIAVRVDRRKVQEMLYTLGCQVELWFEPNLTKKRPKFNCVRGRLTLGAKSFELPASVSQRTACR